MIGTLYGDGLPELLRNLLYNPQIDILIMLGKDLGNASTALWNFFHEGLEATTILGKEVYQIKGTNRVIDGAVSLKHFQENGRHFRLLNFGKTGDHIPILMDAAHEALSDWPTNPQYIRQEIPMPRFEVTQFPSDPHEHLINIPTAWHAWDEMIYRLYRFGHRVTLAKGERIELPNVKVVIDGGLSNGSAYLESFKMRGFSIDALRSYQHDILSPSLPPDQHYGYGNRLRGHFNPGGDQDSLQAMIRLLQADPETRHAYATLWDTGRDLLTDAPGSPCMATLFARKFDGKLTLTATFRTHNARSAWPLNVYGLLAIQKYIAAECSVGGIPPGTLTVISHSLTLSDDGGGFAWARDFSERYIDGSNPMCRRSGLNPEPDPNGDMVISVDHDNDQIVVVHKFQGQALTEYTGKTAAALKRKLWEDMVITRIDHAMYVGGELERAERVLVKTKRRKAVTRDHAEQENTK